MSEQEINEQSEPKVYQIPEENMPALNEKLAKLNKRAEKLGCEAIVLTVVGEKMVEVQDHRPEDEDYDEYNQGRRYVAPHTHYEKRILVTVSGAAPKLNGWAIAAVIEHTEGGNILRAVPPFASEAFGIQFRTSDPICEHCGFDRKRKDTYIVKNDDGRQAQVGRTCLKDFTGHKSPEAVASWAEIISQLEDMMGGFGGSGSGVRYYTLQEVLETAACVIRRDGFMSKAAAYKIAQESGDVVETSAGKVAWLFAPITPGRGAEKEREAKAAYKVEDTDKAKAQLAQEWAANMNPTEAQDYLWNLHVVANMEHVTQRNFGLTVSMISAYQRESDRLAGIEYERKTRPVSEFVGTLGKREDFTLTVKKLIGFDGNYGHTVLHIMLDQNGNKLTWFKSGNADMEEGKTYVVKGTVKNHEVYNRNKDYEGNPIGQGEKQTILSRCKIVREIEAAAVTPDESVMNVFA
jgi:hypothetical protein